MPVAAAVAGAQGRGADDAGVVRQRGGQAGPRGCGGQRARARSGRRGSTRGCNRGGAVGVLCFGGGGDKCTGLEEWDGARWG